MKLLLIAAIVAVLFISGCATQQTQPTKTPSNTLSPTQTVDVKHYSIKQQDPPISLVSDIENVVSQIADCYYKASKKSLTVTSGTRGSSSQAEAMFDKLELGDNLDIYSNKVARDEIKKAYDNGMVVGKGDSEIVADMVAVIENQIAAGTYISNHLRSGAVDFSQQDMTASDKNSFKQCANSVKGVGNVIDESNPVHFHIEIAATIPVVVPPTQSPIATITPSPSLTPIPTPRPIVNITPTSTPTPTPRVTSSATIASFSCVIHSVNHGSYDIVSNIVTSASGTATGNVGDEFGLIMGFTNTAFNIGWTGEEKENTGSGKRSRIRLAGDPETTTWTAEAFSDYTGTSKFLDSALSGNYGPSVRVASEYTYLNPKPICTVVRDA